MINERRKIKLKIKLCFHFNSNKFWFSVAKKYFNIYDSAKQACEREKQKQTNQITIERLTAVAARQNASAINIDCNCYGFTVARQ